ncbi:MAG: cupin domain-containing protein, partial [Bifidobacteriaceae bacterium]|nr:cupin domain-containing protein [Bifidobacteriaceae bacterium]
MTRNTSMDHAHARGWQRYGFDNLAFRKAAIHGSSVEIDVTQAFDRGLWQPHISFAVIPPDTAEEAIGMHIHRDMPTQTDVEEWYIVVEGHGEMTFSNGDTVECGPGDMVAIWPGTGHSFRAIGGPLKLISITHRMFSYREPREIDPWPEDFSPKIKVNEADDLMVALSATCTVCKA